MLKQKTNWSQEQDEFLKNEVSHQEKKNWVKIAQLLNKNFPQKNRTSKQCRQRYINYAHTENEEQCCHMNQWTSQEIQVMFQCFEKWGPRWTKIAENIHGKTENHVKNKFYCTLRKLVRKINFVSKNFYNKFKKQLKYESVFRIINSAETLLTLSEDLKQKSLQIRKKVINLAKNQQFQVSDQFIKNLIEQINQFNLSTRSYKCQRRRRLSDNDQSYQPDHALLPSHGLISSTLPQPSSSYAVNPSSKGMKNSVLLFPLQKLSGNNRQNIQQSTQKSQQLIQKQKQKNLLQKQVDIQIEKLKKSTKQPQKSSQKKQKLPKNKKIKKQSIPSSNSSNQKNIKNQKSKSHSRSLSSSQLQSQAQLQVLNEASPKQKFGHKIDQIQQIEKSNGLDEGLDMDMNININMDMKDANANMSMVDMDIDMEMKNMEKEESPLDGSYLI